MGLYYLSTDVTEKFNLADKYSDWLEKAERIVETAHVEPRPHVEPETDNDLRYR